MTNAVKTATYETGCNLEFLAENAERKSDWSMVDSVNTELEDFGIKATIVRIDFTYIDGGDMAMYNAKLEGVSQQDLDDAIDKYFAK